MIIAENFEVFDNDAFHCEVLWKLGQGEWNFFWFLRSVTFVVRFLDRFR